MIDSGILRGGLTTREFGRVVHTFGQIDSTNLFAKSLSSAPHGTIVIADEQTAGRGRQGRSWMSPPGENLLFSLILRPDFGAEKAAVLPFAAALGVADGVRAETRLEAEVKWPNDLLLGGKKFCGMLIEGAPSEQGPAFVLGVGVNVNQRTFPHSLAAQATSLALETGVETDRIPLLRSILQSLELRYDELRRRAPSGIVEEWKRRTTMLGRTITIREGGHEVHAVALDIAPTGALVIETGGKRKSVLAGDVTVVRE